MEQYIKPDLNGDVSQTGNMFGTMPIILDYWGRERCRPGHSWGPFVRTGFLIHVILEGKGKLYWKDKVFEISAGQAFLIYPNEETTYQADMVDPWNYMWVGFHGLEAKKILAMAGFDENHVAVTCRNMPKLKEILEKLLSVQTLNYVDNLRRASLMLEFFALLIENNEKERILPQEGQNAIYVNMAVNLLMTGSNTPIKIGDVAKTIGISRNYLTTIFHQEIGMSPQKFLMNYRMEKSINLLGNTNNSIGLIAEEVGYSDCMSFNKAFRTHYGMSPSRYREEHLEKKKTEELDKNFG